MKNFEITPEWCAAMAAYEGEAEIGAGLPDHPLRQVEWLVQNGWIQAPDGTWGLPQSTCRSVSTQTAYQLGQIIAGLDDE